MFIVLGSVFLVAYIVVYSVVIGSAVNSANNGATAVSAINQLNGSYSTLTSSLTAGEQAATSCNQNLTCVTKQDSKAASAFQRFSSQLASTPVPAGAAADKARLSSDSAALAQGYTELSKATSTAQYQSTFASIGLQQRLNGFGQDFTALGGLLQTY
jgi:hypothetical protein